MNKTDYHAKSGYRGKTARDYDRKRQKRKKWKLELAAVETLVKRFDDRSFILDTPLGTGRFLHLYQPGNHHVLGLDISMDMLKQAKGRLAPGQAWPAIARGDAETIPLKDKSVDYIVCIRLLNWLTDGAMENVIREFQRVARKGIIIGFRTRRPMKTADFIKMGLLELAPTPRHLKKWTIAIHRFYMRVKGKLKKIARQTLGSQAPAPASAPVLTGSNIYDRPSMMNLFSTLGLAISGEHPIDRTASFARRTVNPYAIYFLEFEDN